MSRLNIIGPTLIVPNICTVRKCGCVHGTRTRRRQRHSSCLRNPPLQRRFSRRWTAAFRRRLLRRRTTRASDIAPLTADANRPHFPRRFFRRRSTRASDAAPHPSPHTNRPRFPRVPLAADQPTARISHAAFLPQTPIAQAPDAAPLTAAPPTVLPVFPADSRNFFSSCPCFFPPRIL